MLNRKSLILFTLVFAIVGLFGVSQLWAVQPLAPGKQEIPIDENLTLVFHIQNGQLVLAEFCDATQDPPCRNAIWVEYEWRIDMGTKPPGGFWDRAPVSTEPSSFTVPALYSNSRCYLDPRACREPPPR